MAVTIESMGVTQYTPQHWNGNSGKRFVIGRDEDGDKYLNHDGNWEESTISGSDAFFWSSEEEAEEAMEAAKSAIRGGQPQPTPPP